MLMRGKSKSLESRMKYLNKLLSKDYTDEQGQVMACSLIAFEIAGALIEKGLQPEIISFVASEGTLIPKPYDGRIKWGGHVVCIADDCIYDPMVSDNKIPSENYIPLAFINGNVELSSMKLTTDDIQRLS